MYLSFIDIVSKFNNPDKYILENCAELYSGNPAIVKYLTEYIFSGPTNLGNSPPIY